MQIHIQHNKDEQTQFFKKYIPLTLFERVTKGLLCERELETEQRLQNIDPNSSGYSSISFPFSCAVQPGVMVLIPASSLQLLWTSCHRGYIIIWSQPTSYERHNSHSIQPLDSQSRPLISSTGCTCYLHRCISSFDSLAGVNMQQYKTTIKNEEKYIVYNF